jgi:Mg2+/Co2+ transporter CorB
MGPSLALIRSVPAAGTLLLWTIIFVVLIALSAFMSGSETALIGFSRLRRRQLVEEAHPRIDAVEALMGNTERFLITVLLLNTVINIGAAAIVTSFADEVFDNYVVAISTGVVTFFMLTFGEIIPKAFAANNAEGWALRVAPAFLAIQKVVSPIVWVYEKMMHALLRDRAKRATFRSEE